MSTLGTKAWTTYGSGFLGDLSDEQRRVMEDFLRSVPRDDMDGVRFRHETDESFALRFLRARMFDIPAAVTLVAATAAWRREFQPHHAVEIGADATLGCALDEVQRFYPHAYLPTPDREGRPVYFEHTGSIDVGGLLIVTKEERLVRYHVSLIEGPQADMMATTSVRPDRIVDNVVTVLDLDGLSSKNISKRALNFVQHVSRIDTSYYPETMGHMFIINAPSVFSMVWSFVKTFIDERTKDKIEILGGVAEYLPRLLRFIPGEELPVEYGGKRVFEGGFYPRSRTRCVSVASSQRLQDDVSVDKGAVVQFKWFTRPGELTWSLSFRPADGGPDVVLHEPKIYPRSGEEAVVVVETAPSAGMYVSVWDNTAGWRARDVYFRHDILNGTSAAPRDDEEVMLSGDAKPDERGHEADDEDDPDAVDIAALVPAAEEATAGSGGGGDASGAVQ